MSGALVPRPTGNVFHVFMFSITGVIKVYLLYIYIYILDVRSLANARLELNSFKRGK